MNTRWREIAVTCWEQRTDGLHFDQEMFAELIVRECISCVGSQGDKAYLKKHFGLHLESEVIYPATEQSGSIESQYKRKYNLAPNPDMGGI
jgi:hypothetical protein